jgi:hypothetical protein
MVVDMLVSRGGAVTSGAGNVMMIGLELAGPGVGTALVDIGANCENNRQQELQLLLGHGLQVHGIVVRLHAEAHASLERPNPCCLANLDCWTQ